MAEFAIIFISAIFVNNILLSQFLGVCPFLGVSNKLSTAAGMSMAVCFVITLATVVTYLLNSVLVMCGLEFLQTISFILVIAALVQMVEIVLKKISPSLYAALGIFLPLITTNCAVLGVALTVVTKDYSLGMATWYAFSTSLGFGLAMVLFAGLREQLSLNNVPKAFKGIPIALITASVLAMAFMGFSGLVSEAKAEDSETSATGATTEVVVEASLEATIEETTEAAADAVVAADSLSAAVQDNNSK